MKILKRVDDIGRVTLPKDFRGIYNIAPGDSVEIVPTEEGLLISSCKNKISDKIRIIAAELESVSDDLNDFKIIDQLMKIANDLEIQKK